MKKLISFEFRKLFKNKSFYICLGITAGLVFLNALLTKSMADANEYSVDPNSFILKFTSNGSLSMIMAIFTSIFSTEDYTCGTIKNIYAKGYSRNEVYLSKFIVSTVSALFFMTAAFIISCSASENLFSGTIEQNDTFMISIILQFILLIAYNSLFFVISIIIGKLGSSIALSILGPSIVSLLLSLLDSFLNQENFKLTNYWLDNCLSSVQIANCSQSVIISSFIISMIVIAVSTIIGLKLNSKKEF